MAAFESGRRLCLLFEAGSGRFAVEATSVMEVSPPDESGQTIRGLTELQDLSVLLGGAAEERPGVGVVLDTSPTFAVRVKRVLEVADVARSPLFMLPPNLGEALALVVRGAIFHGERLFLELSADALPRKPHALGAATARPIYPADHVPDRALVFESQGRLFGVPLGFVSQVVTTTDAFCPLPSPMGAVAGLLPHAQVLWPVYSAPGLMGGQARREELVVLTELAGQNVGLAAQRVLGVMQGFTSGAARGELECRGLSAPALFLDLQRMFS